MTDANPYDQLPPLTRQAPHNLDAEQALLGAILINSEAYERVSSFVVPEHFYDPLHQEIYRTAAKLITSGKLATPITLRTFFEHAERIDATLTVPQYLGRLASNAATIINAKEYGRTIQDLAIRRHLILIGEDMVNAAYDSPVDFPPREQIEEAEARLYGLTSEGMGAQHGGSVDFKTAALAAAAMAETAAKQGAGGLSTGLYDLDAKTGGLFKSDLIILAGRPSMGKTALITNLAVNIAKAGTVVDFYTLEMAAMQVALRVLAAELGVPAQTFRTGQATQAEVEALFKKAHDASLPIYFDQTGGIGIEQLTMRARRNKRRYGTGLIIVDYLQLMQAKTRRGGGNRVQDITEITTGLKALAMELDVPVVALSQLNRGVENRDNKRPQLGDLRESGSIEQDADVVLFVFREDYYAERERPVDEQSKEFMEWATKWDHVEDGTCEAIIGKLRNGPLGTAMLQFDAKLMRFSNLARSGYATIRR